jgi:hypothetical protein
MDFRLSVWAFFLIGVLQHIYSKEVMSCARDSEDEPRSYRSNNRLSGDWPTDTNTRFCQSYPRACICTLLFFIFTTTRLLKQNGNMDV